MLRQRKYKNKVSGLEAEMGAAAALCRRRRRRPPPHGKMYRLSLFTTFVVIKKMPCPVYAENIYS